jgi:putative intracellular protease/amidase
VAHVLVVCDRRFNGNQLWIALGTLTKRGHTYKLISTSLNVEDERTKVKYLVHGVVGEVPVEAIGTEFQAYMMISGNPEDTEAYWRDASILAYVKAANDLNLPIAAICFSVPAIREAAVGKKVSFFPIIRARQLLQDTGAILNPVAMTRDQNLVTAEHEMAAGVWAKEFCNLIEGLPQETFFAVSPLAPKGRERMPVPEIEALKGKRGSQEEQ